MRLLLIFGLIFIIGIYQVYKRITKDDAQTETEQIEKQEGEVFYRYEWKNPPMPDRIPWLPESLYMDNKRNTITGYISPADVLKIGSALSSLDTLVSEAYAEGTPPKNGKPPRRGLEGPPEASSIIREAQEIPLPPLLPVLPPEPEKELFKYRYLNTLVTEENIEFLTSRGLSVDSSTGYATGLLDPEQIPLLDAYVKETDIEREQITVEAIFSNVTLTNGSDFSFEWLMSVGSFRGFRKFNLQSSPGFLSLAHPQLEVSLQSAVEKGFVKVISRPSITLEVGNKATLSAGREIGIVSTQVLQGSIVSEVEYKNVGFSLEVTLKESSNGYIMDLVQRSEDVLSNSVVGGNPVPELSTESISSRLLLDSDRWHYIGGLSIHRDTDSLTRSKPLGIFSRSRDKSNERNETILFIRAISSKPSAYARKL